MTRSGATLCPISPAHLTGLAAIKSALILAFFRVEFASAPLILFIVLCGLSSLMPRSRFFLPLISRGRADKNAVALTFDDGPDPATTPRLLDLLAAQGIRATFFVPGRRASLYPEIIRDILSRGHDIANHSWRHDPLLMLRGQATLNREIEACQEALGKFGIVPLAFRPPVGVTNPMLWRVLLRMGLICVTFSCRAGDFGNRRIDGLARRILQKVRPGDIIMLHDVMPRRGMDVDLWLREVAAIVAGLRQQGMDIVGLGELIGQPVMRRQPGDVSGPVAGFYDGLAEAYDREQFESGVSMAKRTECRLVLSRLPELISASDRILEIGAGTGIFTLPLAGRCREVVAVDVSAGMLSVLDQKARAVHVENILVVAVDIEKMEIPGVFDVICAFSSFEYFPDLAALIRRLSSHLKPGGRLYFTTAHRSLFRFFTQIGNAMRQGIWLHARGKKEVLRMLAAGGLEAERLQTHLFRSPVSGGMILEVQAKKK